MRRPHTGTAAPSASGILVHWHGVCTRISRIVAIPQTFWWQWLPEESDFTEEKEYPGSLPGGQNTLRQAHPICTLDTAYYIYSTNEFHFNWKNMLKISVTAILRITSLWVRPNIPKSLPLFGNQMAQRRWVSSGSLTCPWKLPSLQDNSELTHKERAAILYQNYCYFLFIL